MSDIKNIFLSNKGRLIHKWDHYFAIYERHFSRFRDCSPRVLEIGVSHGGSLHMWQNYFGKGSAIHGIDLDPRCASLADENTKVFIGNQTDRDFLRSVVAQAGPFDIVIDDGGHRMMEQIVSLEVLLPSLSPNGIYLVEDLHTSYWQEYGGGLGHAGTFIEYAKKLIDEINGWHLKAGRGPTVFTQQVTSMTFYDSVLVFEKTPRTKPFQVTSGKASF